MNNDFYDELVQSAKMNYPENITWSIGGNAPLMGIRFIKEGTQVLLAADMSKRMRSYMPNEMHIVGDIVDKDDVHLILEYNHGDRWGPYEAPRANRLILHHDQQNLIMNMIESFGVAMTEFSPHLMVVSGLQLMDSQNIPLKLRVERLLRVHHQLHILPSEALAHFELATFSDWDFFELLQKLVFPYVNSLSMNEQELNNLRFCFQFGRLPHATDSNPSVARTLDQMRIVFQTLTIEYFLDERNSRKRLISRIHVHTLAYQIILTTRGSKWKNSKIAAAKASLTAHRYVCQNDKIKLQWNSLLLDDSFTTSRLTYRKNVKRMNLDLTKGVICWRETIELPFLKAIRLNGTSGMKIAVEFCMAPVLVCQPVKKTAGAGDNISAAALAVQI